MAVKLAQINLANLPTGLPGSLFEHIQAAFVRAHAGDHADLWASVKLSVCS
jgi:hypothetical protein